MTNEHVLMVETHIPVNYTMADTGFLRGTLLKATSPNTAATSDGTNDIVAGVLAGELISGSGVASGAVYRGGRFKAVLSGSGSDGDAIVTKGSDNLIIVATVDDENILGTLLEDGTDGQEVIYELNPTTIQTS